MRAKQIKRLMARLRALCAARSFRDPLAFVVGGTQYEANLMDQLTELMVP